MPGIARGDTLLDLRNRLGAQAMHNKRKMSQAVEALSKRIGFRVAPGFSERVIFRELFPRGLTLLDLRVQHSYAVSFHHQGRVLQDLKGTVTPFGAVDVRGWDLLLTFILFRRRTA